MSSSVDPVSEKPITRRKGLGKTALFSDGYINGVVGEINTILKRLYPEETSKNNYSTLFSSMAFAGTVVGMLGWGYLVDRFGRKSGMMSASSIIVVFTALSAGAYGAGGSTQGLLQALIAYRFLSGIGIGAEYPAGSVACSENTEEPGIRKRWQHMLFMLATNCMIDIGFVVAAFVPLVLIWICTEDHLRLVWRLSFGLGVIPASGVLLWRLRMFEEPTRYQTSSIRKNVPYWLILKRYWRSFVGLSLAWFIYDFIIVDTITGGSTALTTVFAWNVVINAFYLPGCIGGALIVDYLGPKKQMILFLCLQGIIGFFMSGFYVQLTHHVAGFAVVYGLFLSFGEAGPGDCLGLLASKSWPTAVRGQMYGVAAAIGKIGAFVGTWSFPAIIDDFPVGPKQTSGPFWIGSGLAFLSAIIVLVLVPEVKADHMVNEDAAFKEYLEANGYDISQMGTGAAEPVDMLEKETSYDGKGSPLV
ncbi:SPOSA6832_05017 [Sporobolomyces salmonicolor]|uniref:SPOSA6832_05017-mRNA-1:cds n=1 Tax=Sporidiobolus salmonicolor TaxID=5005 RepID=A0A0D6ETK1_SPOSA|nr:SPOSA6832_05017 [Sporobolomyces salmonicolor]